MPNNSETWIKKKKERSPSERKLCLTPETIEHMDGYVLFFVANFDSECVLDLSWLLAQLSGNLVQHNTHWILPVLTWWHLMDCSLSFHWYQHIYKGTTFTLKANITHFYFGLHSQFHCHLVDDCLRKMYIELPASATGHLIGKMTPQEHIEHLLTTVQPSSKHVMQGAQQYKKPALKTCCTCSKR